MILFHLIHACFLEKVSLVETFSCYSMLCHSSERAKSISNSLALLLDSGQAVYLNMFKELFNQESLQQKTG